MRHKHLLWVLPLTALLGLGTVWATTHHTITVDGKILDFTADEKTAGDAKGDSAYATNNDLTTLYVTWDASNLYIGFAYSAWGTAIMYMVDTGKAGGVSNFCPSAGYKGAFPANIKGPSFDVMIGMWLAPNIVKQPTPYIYALANNTSKDITASAGVKVVMKETALPKVPVHQGVVEAAIPWNVLYGMGPGKVPQGGRLRIAGVVRGAKDGDGVGDVAPNCTGAVSGKPCGSAATNIDKQFTILVDGDCDGKPDKGCKPGYGSCPGGKGAPCATKKDAGPPDKTAWPDKKAPTPDKALPTPDKKAPTPDKALPTPDKKAPAPDKAATLDTGKGDDFKAAPDSKAPAKDGKVVADAPPTKSDAVVGDTGAKADSGKKLQTEDGCACSAQGTQSMSMGLLGLGLLTLISVTRRRRR